MKHCVAMEQPQQVVGEEHVLIMVVFVIGIILFMKNVVNIKKD
jgi:hypothetical protein